MLAGGVLKEHTALRIWAQWPVQDRASVKTLSELRLERGCGGQARRWPARGCRLGWRGQAGCAALGDMEFVQVFGKAWGRGAGTPLSGTGEQKGWAADREKCPISPSQRTATEQIQMLRVGIIS